MWTILLVLGCPSPDAPPPGSTGSPSTSPSTGTLPDWATTESGRLLASCPTGDLVVDGLEGGVVRLQHLRTGAAPDRRSFAVALPDAAPVEIAAVDGSVRLSTPDLVVTVDPSCKVTVADPDGNVLMSDGTHAGFADLGDQVAVARETPPGERFYGLGERTGPLQKRGTTAIFRNTDAYDSTWGAYRPDQDPLYVAIPFFVSVRDGRAAGVFTDVPYESTLDLASSDPGAWTWTASSDRIDQYVIAGPAMPDVVRRFTDLVGRAPVPPLWSLGWHQCRWGYWPDDRLRELASEFRSRRIPADALWLDIQHQDGFRTFTWDPAGFPDPAGLARDLDAQGFELVTIADPGLKEEPGWPVWDDALAGDHLLKNPDGSTYLGTVWAGPSGFPDFSRPETRSWWGSEVQGLANLGVDGIWLDVNEPTTFPEGGHGLTVDDAVEADGEGVPTTMAEVHDVYGLLEAEATADALRTADRRPFVLSRAGYAGIERHAATWTGDVSSTWDGLRLTLPMLLGLGISGQPFVGSDVGGYSGRAPDGTPTSPELFARWIELGAISPFARGHATNDAPDQEPWAFGTEVEDVSRIHLDWRYSLLPYLYSLFDEASLDGAPILRPLVWEFPDDERLFDLGDEAMLGPWLLVAPVVEPGAESRRVVLPEGRWYELHSGAIWDGPAVVDLDVTLQSLPVFAREGAIVPVAPSGRQSTRDPGQGPPMLDLYPADAPTSFVLYEDSGDGSGPALRTTLSLARTPSGATLSASRSGGYDPGPRDLLVRIRRADRGATSVTLDGVPLASRSSREEVDASGGFWWDPRDLSVVARFADPGDFELAVDYDPTIDDPRPPVDVDLAVHVPAGTPADPPIHVASDATNWEMVPLEWDPVDPLLARGTLSVPRGGWYRFKYTRGDWCTVEKYPDCVEADDRYALGAAGLDRDDTVYGWRDWCETCP